MASYPQKNSFTGTALTKSSSAPISPIAGAYWDESRANGSLIGQWAWNGSLWLSRQIYQRSLPLGYGQGIILGGTVGLISANTADTPFNVSNANSIYLNRLTVNFITAGNLSATNYWRLQFKSGATVVQSVNATAGNNSEVTGSISKTGADINILYAHSGRYFVNLIQVGNPPNITNPTCLIEYQLVRS